MQELAPGAVFAGHRIESVAGRGGMGIVYRATQLGLERTIALKVIAPGLLEDDSMRERFVRESKVAASIDHPNVIPIFYAGEEDGIAYIAMRYVAGDDLRHLVRRTGRLLPTRAADIVAQAGAALDAAHAAGLVHRDVKPANILLTSDEHVYLTDFGLTKRMVSVEGSSTRPGHWVGTLDYVAPEQIRGERVDARADVYSLGCMLFFTLTGQIPFRRDDDEAKLWAHLTEPASRPSAVVPTVPPEFDAVVARALAKEPDDRYPSAGDLGRAALTAAGVQPPAGRERVVAKGAAAPVEPEAETVVASRTAVLKRSRARRPALLILSLTAAAAGGVIGALALAERGKDDPSAAATPTATATATATPTAGPGLHVDSEVKVGNRPNVVRTYGDNVYVASARSRVVRIVSVRTGNVRSYAPEIGTGATDAAIGLGSIWYTLQRRQELVRIDARTGRPRGSPISLTGRPFRIAVAAGAVFVSLIHGEGLPDELVKVDPDTGQTLWRMQYRYGIASLTAAPNALWVANRRRAWVERVRFDTGQITRSVPIGPSHSEDAVYSRGALWLAMPADDIVFKLVLATGEMVPIAVGRRPRQLAIGRGGVFVSHYDSSELWMIDEESAGYVGEPVRVAANPYSLAVDRRGAVWVASQPSATLTKLLTGPDA